MGANYKDQEKAIAELSALSREAKIFLNHHIGNPLTVIIGAIEQGKFDIAKEVAWHIVDDLRLAGIREDINITTIKEEISISEGL